jgi:hypothetical protein
VAPFKDCSPAGSLHSFVIADRLKHLSMKPTRTKFQS